MPINITMPALSPTMEEGTLAKWHVKEGDTVSAGDVIAEIETDKATMEVEAVDEGVVQEILVPEGSEGVKVNTPIARLNGAESETDQGETKRDKSETPKTAPVQPADESAAGDPEKQPPETVETKAHGEGPAPVTPTVELKDPEVPAGAQMVK